MMYSEKAPKVSVIMPVYNSQKYVGEAIESILKQTLAEFELILVDDGSTDQSGAICDEYAKKDVRIHVIHKENGGICSARNAGLAVARGEYLAFCDNDDKYLPDLLKDNYEFAKEHDADIVRFKRKRIAYVDGRKITSTAPAFRFAVLRGEEIAKNYLQITDATITVWNALYRRNMVCSGNIRFPEKMRYGQEDAWFNYSCYERATCIVFNPNVYYYWIQRDGHSTTSKYHMNLMASCLACMKKEWHVMERLGVARFEKDCYLQVVCRYLIRFYQYMNRSACRYNFLQKAGMLRLVCKQIPDKEKLVSENLKNQKLLQAILYNRGMQIYRIIKGMNVLE